MKILFTTAALLCAALAGHAQTPSHTLTVNINEVKNPSGVIFIALVDPSEKTVQKQAVPVKDKAVKVLFHNVAPGTYAVKFFHDENNNRELDKGIFGVPKEGWGCSNDASNTFGPPKFQDMLFSFKGDKTIAMHVN